VFAWGFFIGGKTVKTMIFLLAILLLGCGGKEEKNKSIFIAPEEKGKMYGDWKTIIPSRFDTAGLYRYEDRDFGVIIYISSAGMTSQKVGNSQ
jgi:hypothetical protein